MSDACDILDDVPGSPAQSYFWRRKRQRGLQLLTRHWQSIAANADPPSVFADLGCGWGTDLFFFSQALRQLSAGAPAAREWRFIGIDGDFEKMDHARQRLADAGVRIELIRDDFTERIPLGDHSVDVLYCSEVLEHMEDPVPFLAEWRRVLRPGGAVLVTTPNEPNVFQRSFYSRKRREANRLRVLASPQVVTTKDGKTFSVYGHIGIRRIDEWEELFARQGFHRWDYERGALYYGNSALLNRAWVFAAQRLAEGLLGLLPVRLTRFLSDQLIGLYRLQ